MLILSMFEYPFNKKSYILKMLPVNELIMGLYGIVNIWAYFYYIKDHELNSQFDDSSSSILQNS